MHPDATGQFSRLLHDLSLAAKLVWREVTKAGLVNILGTTDRMNISGDIVKKLDEFADQTIYRTMDHGGHLCVMASEENEDLLHIPEDYRTASTCCSTIRWTVGEHRRERHDRNDLLHLPARLTLRAGDDGGRAAAGDQAGGARDTSCSGRA